MQHPKWNIIRFLVLLGVSKVSICSLLYRVISVSVVQVKSSPSEASMGKAFTLVHVQHVTHRPKHSRSAAFPHTCSSLNQKTNTRSYLYKKKIVIFIYTPCFIYILLIFFIFLQRWKLVWRSESGACADCSKEPVLVTMLSCDELLYDAFLPHLISKHKNL